MTHEEMADKIVAAAECWAESSNRTAFPELRAVYQSDKAKLLSVAEIVREGSMRMAYRAFWELDTIVRDVIPQDVFDQVAKEGGYE